MSERHFSLSPPLFPVSLTISLFLVELEKSAEALQDYGVLVGKVSVDPCEHCASSVIEVDVESLFCRCFLGEL